MDLDKLVNNALEGDVYIYTMAVVEALWNHSKKVDYLVYILFDISDDIIHSFVSMGMHSQCYQFCQLFHWKGLLGLRPLKELR